MNTTQTRIFTAAIIGSLIGSGLNQAPAAPTNLLLNPGFETGNFAGWTLGGNSLQSGVATDGTLLTMADDPFPPNFQNVRSGTFAGHALVREFVSLEVFTLSQTIPVVPNRPASVGFYYGNDSSSGFGVDIDDTHLQIFIDSVGQLPNGFRVVPFGNTPADFSLFQSNFNTGARNSITVTFALTGSGSSRINASFDDFFLTSDPVPEPSTLTLLGLAALSSVGRRKRAPRGQ